MAFRLFILSIILLCGCKSSHINEGKVLSHDEYKHYYVVKEQGTDKDIGERVDTVTEKIKKVFKKEPVNVETTTKSETVEVTKPKVVPPIKLPKRRVRETQEVTEIPIVIDDTKLMPMTEEQVEIVELKNSFVASVAYVQAIFILGLVGFILYIYHKNKKKKIVSDKVLKL
jgi:hypothetical protein